MKDETSNIYFYTLGGCSGIEFHDAVVSRDLKHHGQFRNLFLILVMKTRSHCCACVGVAISVTTGALGLMFRGRQRLIHIVPWCAPRANNLLA